MNVTESGMAVVRFGSGRLMVPLDQLTPVFADPVDRFLAGHLEDATAYGLRLRSEYLRHAYRYDDLAGLSSARIEPTLHQVYVAHRVVSKLRSRMILADEVGLGKTIEAGLVLKELTARGLVERALVIVPASLQHQWRTELASKFNEHFDIVDGQAARFLGRGGHNPWTKRNRIICSVNLAANRKHAEQIVAAGWDLVIFDEAHRVRRSLQSKTRLKTTLAYELADELKEDVPSLLLLTATPMQLHPFELYSLIELIEPGLFGEFEDYDRRRAELPELNHLMKSLLDWHGLGPAARANLAARLKELLGVQDAASYGEEGLESEAVRVDAMDRLTEKHPLTAVLVRNRKAEVGGFTGREAKRFLVEMTPEEQGLYDDVSEYIRRGYQRAQREKRYAVGFLMVLYQQMLSSSSTAVRESFKRRIAKLEERRSQLQAVTRRSDPGRTAVDELREVEELSLSLDELEQLAVDEDAIAAEINELEDLVARLGTLRDSKAFELVKAVKGIFGNRPDEKVLIFTQYIETQRFIAAALAANGIESTVFNGSLNAEQKEEAVRKFRGRSPVLISTEAGGEGRNFQFCHIMINYDLPWNPMKIEQRIGRLDRIGQKRTVFIYNLACEGTVEERVLNVLEDRIGLFEESVGSLDPILGDLERDIEKIVLAQVDRYDEEFTRLEVEIESRVNRARQTERLMSDFILDRSSFRRDVANELLRRRPMATYEELERAVADVLAFSGGRLDGHEDGGVVLSLAPRLATKLGVRETTIRGVFDWKTALEKEELPFFAMGHPLIDRIVDLALVEAASVGARSLDGAPPGVSVEVIYELQAEGFARSGRLIRHVVSQDLSVVSDTMKVMPDIGRAVTEIEVPHWAPAALERSAAVFGAEQREFHVAVERKHSTLQERELERARRIHAYREARLGRRIREQEDWIAEKEQHGTERDFRILPARRGRLEKERERLRLATAQFEEEVGRIQSRSSGVAARVVAVGLVIGE